MLPVETRLEVRSHLPARAKRPPAAKPPLLFVHGGFCDSWCWEPYFLPYFAAHGYPAHALSLRGHGASGGRDTLFVASIDDYATDVEQVIGTLPAPPILIGHSMGAAVVERLLGRRTLCAAVLMAPVSPAGLLPLAARLSTQRPEFLLQMGEFDPLRLDGAMLDALRPFYFSDEVHPQILRESIAHFSQESTRALIDLSLRMPWDLPRRNGTALRVVGAAGDQICPPDEVAATARHHGVVPTILPGLAHVMMLDLAWERPARELLGWFDAL